MLDENVILGNVYYFIIVLYLNINIKSEFNKTKIET